MTMPDLCTATVAIVATLLSACAQDQNVAGARPGAQPGKGGNGSIDIDAGASSKEACDGYDDNRDGRVDENCQCKIGQTQPCFPWAPGEEPVCAPAGIQSCEGAGEFTQWKECVLPKVAEATELCTWWILGADAGDSLRVGDGVGWGDFNADGDVDFVAPSVNGQVAGAQVGAGYVIFGSPSVHGTVLDLKAEPLDGARGFVVDNFRAEAAYGHKPTSASIGDVNGDGRADVVGTESYSSLLLAYGDPAVGSGFTVSDADGSRGSVLSGATTSWTLDAVTVTDFDGDGYADVFSGGWNTCPPQGPCSPFGTGVWFGDESLGAKKNADQNVASGIGHVGMASLMNFTNVAGTGDFDNDGYSDITSMTGAANDGSLIAYVSYVWHGNPTRELPSAMNALSGGNGTVIGGGTGRGVIPNHHHGDLNGDGIDDLVLNGAANGSSGSEVYVYQGSSAGFGAQLSATVDLADLAPIGSGLLLQSTRGAMGVGDIDADGFDELVLPTDSSLFILWGSAANGKVELASSSTVSSIDLSKLGDAAGAVTERGAPRSVSVADIDGDGFGDLLIGFSSADTKNGTDSGAGAVVFGASLYGLHTPNARRRGGGNDTIVDDAGAHVIVVGRGNDVVEGGGGADSISAGHGDDLIVIPDTNFRRINGGFGVDTLRIVGAADLDFRSIGRARVTEIERFDLGDPGAQKLAFNSGDLSAMGASREIWVEGGSEDALTLSGSWTKSGLEFRHGALVVHVSNDLVPKVKIVP